MVANQLTRQPGHTWENARLDDEEASRFPGRRVEHFMSTDLFTVHEEELVDFVAVLMDWRRIRYVPVEDYQHRLVGIVNQSMILRFLAEQQALETQQDVPVKEIMVKEPVSISPETSTRDAIALMREHDFGALPVVRDGHLVGIVTESDVSWRAARLMDDSMRDD